ncbi:hypothetical protein H8356DRAFT_1671330 [Neocallimastix lanati (nom. inval.)]|jgi:hypothetical protein|uniref:TLC domain-containing protein n=1 Tax=Neocallimastix californiae TaxID=1754190 RepID=A0A1Y2FFX7_9FUNG|nr:hypothetical protein H8356DRAFT_1671330 [Neocallimastix sp. JGI-2020a]ORY82196.1 hypothetical protein LY90DRAFT_664060 [Neocallimastix californiae]|eukprot:ORY82196.1 hypothetical protein LY90DRAFT_664060 [Neocallimastix californiae]
MFEYFKLDKDEMIYSSEIFYYVIPVYIIIRIFIFYLFEVVTRSYSKRYSVTYKNSLTEKQKKDWTSKATSIFHAILVTILCIPHTITDIVYRKSNKDLAFGITKRRVDVLLWILAYLIYDLYMMIRISGKKVSKAMLLHHFVCISAFLLGLYLNVGTVFMASFIINELSTPFLHFRWYLSRMKMRDSKIAFINNLIFAITYLIVRGIWNTYVFFVLCKGFWEFRDGLHGNSVPFGIIACLPLFALSHLLLNYYWLYLIILQVIHPKKTAPDETPENSTPSSPTIEATNNEKIKSSSKNNTKNEASFNNTELEGITISNPSTSSNDVNSVSSNSSTSSLNKPKEFTPLLKTPQKPKSYSNN